MIFDIRIIQSLYDAVDPDNKKILDQAIDLVIDAKLKGKRVVVATGSGPNIHEGVTTLIAELMDKGIVDGVTTSSAVIAHEMGGVLDKVKRIHADQLETLIDTEKMPRGNIFEITLMSDQLKQELDQEMIWDKSLYQQALAAEGTVIIKAAGNMAYPMGLRTENLAHEVEHLARTYGYPFESIAGLGADPKTMIGVGARKGLPVLVSVPQLVGGGSVGLCVADSIPNAQRSARIAQMLDEADVIIESAVVLTQEIHDGPFERYTGHGIWSDWKGYQTYSLRDKHIIRIDLDENLRKAWLLDKQSGAVQTAIDQGLPKTKMSSIPFRMEMSAFSRHEKSLPIVGDIGVIWPIIAWKVASALDIDLDFMSYPQQTPEGQLMREHIVGTINPINRRLMIEKVQKLRFSETMTRNTE